MIEEKKNLTEEETKIAYTGRELQAPIKLKTLKVIVTGTGRCGTVSVAKMLSHAGLPCGHESIFDHQGMELIKERIEGKKPIELSGISKLASQEEEQLGMFWFNHANLEDAIEIVGDSSYMAAPYLDNPMFDNVKIVHVVREPIKVINSFVGGFNYFKDDYDIESKPYHDFIYNHVPELKEKMHPLTRAALYYIHWNTMIENKAKVNGKQYFLHRVENSSEKLLGFIGAKKHSTYKVLMSWGTCNHKWGLENNKVQYNDYSCIPDTDVRDRLLKLRAKYYNVLI